MWLEFPAWLVTLLNVVGWPVLQLGWGYAFTRMPTAWFVRLAKFPWLMPFEKRESYWQALQIKTWKSWLPDGATWFGGFAKKKLKSRDPVYLNEFLIETYRSELSHWVMLLSGLIFCLWNPPWAIVVMVTFGAVTNIPPILIQRYNRFRLWSVIKN